MNRKLVGIFITFTVAIALLSSCSSEQKSASQESSAEAKDIVGQIDDYTIAEHALDEIIASLSEPQKARYDTPAGRVELVDKMLEEELYHLEGKREGLGKDEEIEKAVEKYRRGLIVTAYYGRMVEPKAYPTEEEMYDFYEMNQERFTRAPIAKAQHIFSKSRDKLVDLKNRIDEGERMTTLASKYSEDELTRGDGGDLGYFNPGGYIRGIGYSEIISDVVFTMEPNVVSDPIKWEKGWSLLRVNELRPAQVQTFEEVREDIQGSFVKQRIDDVKKELYAELVAKYEVTNHLQEELRLTERTPEELWNLAQTSSDSYQRLQNYEQIVERYPDSKYAPQAMFMIGFVQAEELKDFVSADRAFTQVLHRYPESEVAKSAQWMLENMKQPLPKFQNLEELNERIEKESE